MILKKLTHTVYALLLLAGTVTANSNSDKNWIENVGAKSFPMGDAVLRANDFGASSRGLILSTKAIQAAIDSCAQLGGGKVVFEPGIYLTGAIFVKNNVNLCIDEDVELRGAINLDEFPEIDTRVAGIEMKWPAAIINIIDQKNAAVSGKGTIHAQGRYNWERYWQMREEYTPKGLRWASDYDCKRVRTILISNAENVTVKDVKILQSGFWTVHILYSTHITVDGVIINNNIGGHGPSTDGIDIDSSSEILIENCDIDCNDDNFCLKAGRDADGLRVNRPCEYVVIRNCISRDGSGLFTIGSETSGYIKNIEVYQLKAEGTNAAIRLKSALTRGGGLSNINIHDITMNNVETPIEVTLNWNPSYSYASVDSTIDIIPSHWKALIEEVSPEKGIPVFNNVKISNIKASNARTALNIIGNADSYLDNFTLKNIDISSEKSGQVMFTKNWTLENVVISSEDKEPLLMKYNINFVRKD